MMQLSNKKVGRREILSFLFCNICLDVSFCYFHSAFWSAGNYLLSKVISPPRVLTHIFQISFPVGEDAHANTSHCFLPLSEMNFLGLEAKEWKKVVKMVLSGIRKTKSTCSVCCTAISSDMNRGDCFVEYPSCKAHLL